MGPQAVKVKHGDVIEVVKDFDAGVVSPGDRVIHRAGAERWYFRTRMPSDGAAPLYDSSPVLDPDDPATRGPWLKVVAHLDEVPDDPDKFASHPILRPERMVKFCRSTAFFADSICRLWRCDLRFAKNKDKLDAMVVRILEDEPDLLWNTDIGYHFFFYALQDPHRPWRGYTKMMNSIGRALDSSVKRLETAGRIVKNENSNRYRAA